MRAKDPRDQRRYKARRLQVLNAAGWVCYYCGGEANQVDHVIPVSYTHLTLPTNREV